MPVFKLVANVDSEGEGAEQTFMVRAPSVGVADGSPDMGDYLNPREAFFSMSILGKRYQVVLPHGVRGRVVERFVEDTRTPLGYNEALFRLSPLAEAAGGAGASGAGAAQGGEATDADLIAVESPSEGVFYCRPSPDSDPYVSEGAEVIDGTVVGLVEVMKCFNQIRYGGPGLPGRGTVTKVLVEDAAEVTFGQKLFLIRPA